MKSLFAQVALMVLICSSCKPAKDATNTNSVVMPANRGIEASSAPTKPHDPCVNLNAATADELINLPGIGEVMAKRIVDYRELHGRFRRPEEIIIIEGFSERKYRAIAAMVCVE